MVALLSILTYTQNGVAQTTVNYTMQTGNFNSLLTEKNNNPPYAGTYNNNTSEIGQYANNGSFGNTPGAAAFQTFNTSGNGNTGTARTLNVGDRFTITCFVSANPSGGGYIGISFRASTTYTNFFSATDAATVARFQLDNTGGWKVYSGSNVVATSTSGPNSDVTFSIEITSSNTFNATIGSQTFYDLSFGTTGPITSFAVYTYGDGNQNSFWKNGSLTNFGHSGGDGIRLGYGLVTPSTSTISGIISNGINTNSTSTSITNVLRIGGGSGTSVTLNQANTYTGAATINSNATCKLGVSSTSSTSGPLGTNAAGTTVSAGAVLDLNGQSLTSGATEALTLNGDGISSGGALINTSSTPSSFVGDITLGSGARVTATTGNITLSGNISGGSHTLYVGGSSNTTIGGIISGSGGLTDGSLFKDGSGTITLSGTNTYSGNTKLIAGYVHLGSDNTGSVGSITNSPIGTGTLIVNGGAVASDGATARTILNQISMAGNFTLGHATHIGTLTVSATSTLTGNRQITTLSPVEIAGKITGAFSLTKLGSSALTLSNSTNDFTGGLLISEGTVNASHENHFGTGATTLGNSTSAATLNITASLSRTALNIANQSNASNVQVSSGQTFTVSNLGGGSNIDTRFGKTGPGTLSFSGAGTFNGQLMISDGTVILSNNASLGTNQSITTRGLDLGLSVSTSPQPNNVSILVSNGVSIPQSVYVADNVSNATRTIGVNGSGSATFSNEIYLDGDLILAPGNSNTLNFTGALVHEHGLIINSGTTVLSGANTYTGLTTISGGTLQLSRSGGSTLAATSDITLTSGSLVINENQTLRNLTISTGTLSVAAGKTLTINGKLIIGSGVTVNLNGTGVIAYGNNADLEVTTSTTISDAIWPGSGSPTDFIVNGSGITVTLDKSRTLSGSLTLTEGVLTLGNFNLTVSGGISGGSTTAYVNTGGSGKLIRSLSGTGQIAYPVGNGGYSPITLNFTAGTFSSANASVRVEAAKHPSNIATNSFINRYWEVNQSGISNFNCNVTCTYLNGDINGVEADIYAGKFNGSVWSLGSPASIGDNTLIFNNASSFSDFTGGELSAMPVTWLFHRCKAQNGKVQITWGVSEEPATGIYTIERSAEGRHWKPLGAKTPSAPSFTSLTYQFVDAAPLMQNYYRIKHTEKNGEVQYSDICYTQALMTEKPVIRMDAGTGSLSVSFAHDTEFGTVALFDITGRKLRTAGIAGKTTHISTSDLPPGIYELLIESPSYRHSEKLMLTHHH